MRQKENGIMSLFSTKLLNTIVKTKSLLSIFFSDKFNAFYQLLLLKVTDHFNGFGKTLLDQTVLLLVLQQRQRCYVSSIFLQANKKLSWQWQFSKKQLPVPSQLYDQYFIEKAYNSCNLQCLQTQYLSSTINIIFALRI